MIEPSGHVDDFARMHLPPRDEWPELRFDLPELQLQSRFNCAARLLDRALGAGLENKLALVTAEEAWTYGRLAEQACRFARVLVEDLGVEPGNRVLIRGHNTPITAACLLAVWLAGGIAVPTMPLLRAKELTEIVEKARVSLVLCDGGLRDEVPPSLEVVAFGDGRAGSLEALAAAKGSAAFRAVDTAADDICLVAFTSGTTGRPKGTMHFHRDLAAICELFPRSVLDVTEDDVFCGTPPLAFTFGLGGLLLFPLRFGATTVLIPQLAPKGLPEVIARFGATVCFTAPTGYRQMMPLVGEHRLGRLRACVSAGEALPIDTRTKWRERTGIELIDGLGTTEMLHIFLSAPSTAVRPGATGRAIAGYEACVLDERGQPLGPGEVGRLAVKGPTGCRYLDDPRQRDYVQGGWNVTGDSYSRDEDGYFWFHARTDDMIVSAGYNIAGPEVEDALGLHPHVVECACVGVPDAERGQVVKALVVLRPERAGDDELVAELQDFVKSRLAPYKYPRLVEFVDSLPRTATGKLQRARLR